METGEEFASRGFVELLECGDVGLVMEDAFLHPSTSFSSKKPARYLCYEDAGAGGEMGSCEPSRVVTKSVITGSDSSSTSSNCSGSSFSKSTKKGDGEDGSKAEHRQQKGSDNSKKVCKRPKTAAPLKVRKEKLGDRIAALQQLVSPYGKTDTASVLHEAMGYIRFLHDQVQVLSSPYLQCLPSASSSPGWKEEEEGEERYNLRRRGLCLVPVESTVQVASGNGADMWSPAMAMGSSYSSSSNL